MPWTKTDFQAKDRDVPGQPHADDRRRANTKAVLYAADRLPVRIFAGVRTSADVTTLQGVSEKGPSSLKSRGSMQVRAFRYSI